MEPIQPPLNSPENHQPLPEIPQNDLPENHQSLPEIPQNDHENHREDHSLNIDINTKPAKIEYLTENFRSKVLKFLEKSEMQREQKSCVEKGLKQLLPNLVVPNHPTYSWMIHRAIEELHEFGGCTEEAISSFIRRDQQNLPWAHATILRRHLKQLCETREVVLTRKNRYVLNYIRPRKYDYSRVPSPEKNFKRPKDMLKRHKRRRKKNKRRREEESDEFDEDFEFTQEMRAIEEEIQVIEKQKRRQKSRRDRGTNNENAKRKETVEFTQGMGVIEEETQLIENQQRRQKSRRRRGTNNNENAKGKEIVGESPVQNQEIVMNEGGNGAIEETNKEAYLKVNEANKTNKEFTEAPQEEVGKEFTEAPQEEVGEAPPTQEKVNEKHEKVKMIEPRQEEMVESTKGNKEKVIETTQEGGQVIQATNELKQMAKPKSGCGRQSKRKRRPGRPRKIKSVEVLEIPRIKRLPGRPRKIKITRIGTSTGPEVGVQTNVGAEEAPIGNELVPYIGPNEAQDEAIQVKSQIKRQGRQPKRINLDSSMGSNTEKEPKDEVHNQLAGNLTRPNRKRRGRPPKRFVAKTNLGVIEAENLDESENLLATDEVNVIQVLMERICITD